MVYEVASGIESIQASSTNTERALSGKGAETHRFPGSLKCG